MKEITCKTVWLYNSKPCGECAPKNLVCLEGPDVTCAVLRALAYNIESCCIDEWTWFPHNTIFRLGFLPSEKYCMGVWFWYPFNGCFEVLTEIECIYPTWWNLWKCKGFQKCFSCWNSVNFCKELNIEHIYVFMITMEGIQTTKRYTVCIAELPTS